MVRDPNSSILGEPITTFEVGSEEVKDRIDLLTEEATPEATDEMIGIAKDHGVAVTPEMSREQIRDKIYDVL